MARGYLYPAPLPSLPQLTLVGRLPSGVLVGNTDTSGFLFDGTTVTLIRHPGSSLTRLFGNDEDGRLYGRAIIAGISHGFLAVPQGLPDPCETEGQEDTRKGKGQHDEAPKPRGRR